MKLFADRLGLVQGSGTNRPDRSDISDLGGYAIDEIFCFLVFLPCTSVRPLIQDIYRFYYLWFAGARRLNVVPIPLWAPISLRRIVDDPTLISVITQTRRRCENYIPSFENSSSVLVLRFICSLPRRLPCSTPCCIALQDQSQPCILQRQTSCLRKPVHHQIPLPSLHP